MNDTTPPRVLTAVCTRDGDPPNSVVAMISAACVRVGAAMAPIHRPFSIANVRNVAVREMYEGRYTHLMFIDEDVTVQTDCIELLLAMDADMATGQVPCYHVVYGLQVPFIPVMRKQEPPYDFRDWHLTWIGEDVPTPRCGSGCVLIKKEVFDAVGWPWYRWPSDWDEDHAEKSGAGEDIDFCDRIAALGFRIMCSADVRCGHNKVSDVAARIVEPDQTPHDVKWTGPMTAKERHSIVPYASHLPILEEIASKFQIRTVLEYGVGRYSTPLLLDRSKFRHVEEVVSVEHDERWLGWAKEKFANDSRHELVFCHFDALTVRAKMLNDRDLVLIDCGDEDDDYSYKIRVALWEWHRRGDSIVVVHDADSLATARIHTPDAYKFSKLFYCPNRPDTAVFSNKHDITTLEWESPTVR